MVSTLGRVGVAALGEVQVEGEVGLGPAVFVQIGLWWVHGVRLWCLLLLWWLSPCCGSSAAVGDGRV